MKTIPIDSQYVFESVMEIAIVRCSATESTTVFDLKWGTGSGYRTVTGTDFEFAISTAFGSSLDSGSTSGMQSAPGMSFAFAMATGFDSHFVSAFERRTES